MRRHPHTHTHTQRKHTHTHTHAHTHTHTHRHTPLPQQGSNWAVLVCETGHGCTYTVKSESPPPVHRGGGSQRWLFHIDEISPKHEQTVMKRRARGGAAAVWGSSGTEVYVGLTALRLARALAAKLSETYVFLVR